MPAQPTASRPSRPGQTLPNDMLSVRAMEFTDWARTNIRLIIGGAVLVALLIGGLLYYRVYREQRQERAAAEFGRLQQTAASGNVALATRDIERYVRRFEGTTYAAEARVALAQLHLQQNQPAKAVQTLSGAEGEIGDSPLGPQAALLLAAAQQAAGKRDDAIRTYLAVAEEADLKIYQTQALQNAALLRTDAGDARGSAELYRRLVDSHEEGSFERQLFEMRLAEAEAQALPK